MLYELLRAEKNSSKLQSISHNFYNECKAYFYEKMNSLHKKPDNKFAQKDYLLTKVQMENVRKLLDDFHSKRIEKIISLAQDKAKVETIIVDNSVMLRHEKELFEKVYDLLVSHKGETLNQIFDLSKPPELPVQEEKPGQIKQEGSVRETKTESSEVSEEVKTITFLQPVAKFFDAELNSYGPFDIGNTAELPSKIIKILLEKGAIKLI